MQPEGDAPETGSFYWEMVISVVRGPFQDRRFTFAGDRVTMGKAPYNDITLPDETVSRRHLEVVRDPRGYLLRDLGSTNGTFLDGSEVREAFLRNGSQVSVGETRFRFRAVQRQVDMGPEEDEDGPDDLVAVHPEVRRAFARGKGIAPLDLTVLILGEPGTGRRTLARSVHLESGLRDAPFVLVDCSRSVELLERDLFRAGTGALDLPGGATIVLLEPWDIPGSIQQRVADAILNRRTPTSADREGGPRLEQRFLAVSSRPLAPEVARGRLIPELQVLLERMVISLPPLRERTVELYPLARHFLSEVGEDAGERGRRTLESIGRLAEHLIFPDNLRSLRELLHALWRAETSPWAGSGGEAGEAGGLAEDVELGASFAENKARWVGAFERRYLALLMQVYEGNISRAARAADMDRKHLHRLLARHGLR